MSTDTNQTEAVGSPVEQPVRPAPEAIGHLHSDGAFCQERAVDAPVWWPVSLYTEDQLRAEVAAERERWQRDQKVWEDTRTQRDELLAHLAGKAPLPQWAADWLKA